ncbi:hypothetical protein JVU11DRAFT_7213 [Chiua virens]|nr:hypothetical protein JVU11DRAFT_7213 [Chiua virens]
MGLACDQLYKQAYHLFRMYPRQESVILIAISGFWWSYCCYPCVLGEKMADGGEEGGEELATKDDGHLVNQTGIHDIPRGLEDLLWLDETPTKVLQDHLYGFPPCPPPERPGSGRSFACFHNVLPQAWMKL